MPPAANNNRVAVFLDLDGTILAPSTVFRLRPALPTAITIRINRCLRMRAVPWPHTRTVRWRRPPQSMAGRLRRDGCCRPG